jgi:hypothetical protein
MESRRLRIVVMMVALAAGIGACAAKPLDRPLPLGPPKTGPGTIAEARKYLQGRWTFVSMEIFPAGQPPIKVKGTGTLVYDEFANMDVEIHVDPETVKQVEKIGIPVPNGVIQTKGQTLIDMSGHTLRYVREGEDVIRPLTHALDIGRPRYWEAEANQLTLRTKDDKGAVLSVSVWRKESGVPSF